MERQPGEKLPPPSYETLDILANHREALDDIRLSLTFRCPGNNFLGVFRRAGLSERMDLLQDIYGTTDSASTVQAMGRDRSGGRNDVEIWSELMSQATLAFDDKRFRWDVGQVYLRGIEQMLPAAKVLGATLAAQSIYQKLSYPEIHTHDQALRGLQQACELDEDTMEGIVRLLAMPFGTDVRRSTADKVFMVAVKEPGGLTRKAVSDYDGAINTEHFGGPEIIDRNLKRTFFEAINGDESSEQDFATLQKLYPEELAELVRSTDFVEKSEKRIRSKLIYNSDRLASNPGRFLGPKVYEIIPLDQVAQITRSALTDFERYYEELETIRKEHKGRLYDEEKSKLLTKYGFLPRTGPDHYPEAILEGIRSITSRLESLAATQAEEQS